MEEAAKKEASCAKEHGEVDADGVPLKLRKLLGERIMRLRTAAVSAIKHRKNLDESSTKKAELLRNDIENSVLHVFGKHRMCAM